MAGRSRRVGPGGAELPGELVVAFSSYNIVDAVPTDHPAGHGRGISGDLLLSDQADVIVRISSVLGGMADPVAQRAGEIDAETSIVRDLKLDSLAVMDFVMALETEFDTVIPIDALSGVETIGDLARLLQPTSPRPSHAVAGR